MRRWVHAKLDLFYVACYFSLRDICPLVPLVSEVFLEDPKAKNKSRSQGKYRANSARTGTCNNCRIGAPELLATFRWGLL